MSLHRICAPYILALIKKELLNECYSIGTKTITVSNTMKKAYN